MEIRVAWVSLCSIGFDTFWDTHLKQVFISEILNLLWLLICKLVPVQWPKVSKPDRARQLVHLEEEQQWQCLYLSQHGLPVKWSLHGRRISPVLFNDVTKSFAYCPQQLEKWQLDCLLFEAIPHFHFSYFTEFPPCGLFCNCKPIFLSELALE